MRLAPEGWSFEGVLVLLEAEAGGMRVKSGSGSGGREDATRMNRLRAGG